MVKYIFSQKVLSGTLSRVSKGLDPDNDRRFAGPDLGPNCLQRLSVIKKELGVLYTALYMNC